MNLQVKVYLYPTFKMIFTSLSDDLDRELSALKEKLTVLTS